MTVRCALALFASASVAVAVSVLAPATSGTVTDHVRSAAIVASRPLTCTETGPSSDAVPVTVTAAEVTVVPSAGPLMATAGSIAAWASVVRASTLACDPSVAKASEIGTAPPAGTVRT